MAKPAPLALVNPSIPQPPPSLGAAGLAMWSSVQETFRVEDVAGTELLTQACLAADRVAALGARIAQDGEVIMTADGSPKAHPALAPELASRNFIIRVFDKLGLNYEPLRPAAGRPPKSDLNWRKRAD